MNEIINTEEIIINGDPYTVKVFKTSSEMKIVFFENGIEIYTPEKPISGMETIDNFSQDGYSFVEALKESERPRFEQFLKSRIK
ncbi:hypothetical protein LV89_04639 [Arcicella aurantiaca]|uniref:Uncharacterized protein n=1 Tax=Arcicella aurantiaca TaxID=591202 RepID=A0A316DF48_9BACT|nr:hypothetical protein [Arcicella aurantiaca]PWK16887.1 hypothetical protein LV89_04639 [Arcicella aurantiaca]